MRMINKIKMKLTGWHTTLFDLDREQLEKVITFTNIHRLRILAWILIIFNIILMGIQQIYIDQLSLKHITYIDLAKAFKIAPYIMKLRLIFISISAIFLIISKPPAAAEEVSKYHRYCGLAFIIINLIGFSILTGMIQSVGPGIATSYVMAILIVAAFCYLNWLDSILIFGVAWCVMVMMIWSFQQDWLIAKSAVLNCSIMTVIALIISRMIYTSRVREFLNLRRAELQKAALIKANKKHRQLSYLDGLTNIPNRRNFNINIVGVWKRAIRQKQVLSLIMIDVDRFKKYNDTYGHQAGDYALIQIAVTLQGVIKRPGDMIARYGGEEFVVILPDTNLEGARNIGNQMKEVVEQLK